MPNAADYLFVGGPGRSGTSFLAATMSNLPEIEGVEDVELKIFGEVNGLPDLYNALVLHYSLHRASRALNNFRKLFNSLFGGHYKNQVDMQEYLSSDKAASILDEFENSLTYGRKEFPREISKGKFARCVQKFINALFDEFDKEKSNQYRLEKTPHNLLHTRFIESIFPGSKYIHVSRDPRSVVISLRKMSWGPDTFEDCVHWYLSYHSSWMKEKFRCELDGIEAVSFRIEDFHYDATGTNRLIADYLGINSNIDLSRYDYKNLTNIDGKIEESELAMITDLLSDAITDLGYNQSCVGELS
jgi:hypothetical protein